jgi:hypothetical protein
LTGPGQTQRSSSLRYDAGVLGRNIPFGHAAIRSNQTQICPFWTFLAIFHAPAQLDPCHFVTAALENGEMVGHCDSSTNKPYDPPLQPKTANFFCNLLMIDPADWKPLSPAFTAALRRYDRAARVPVVSTQTRDAITAPLYHYTDRDGLSVIITNGEFWLTH